MGGVKSHRDREGGFPPPHEATLPKTDPLDSGGVTDRNPAL